MQLLPSRTTYIKTFRLPTPLLIYQLALIPGSLLTGFLLSPLLYLSRHIAQRPVRRLRFPQEKYKHRRLLALGFYAGSLLIVGGLIGLWTGWCLGGRNPWTYIVFWMFEGKNKWTRPALLGYWGLLISFSVAGWSRQLARSKRWRQWAVRTQGSVQLGPGISEGLIIPSSPRYGAMPGPSGYGATAQTQLGNGNSNGGGGSGATAAASAPNAHLNGSPKGASAELSDSSSTPPPPHGEAAAAGPYGLRLPNLPDLPNGAHLSNVANELLDAADKRVPTLSVNARRKYFHALAVVMFVPGIAVDVRARCCRAVRVLELFEG